MTTLKNHVQLIGRLGAEPQVRNFESGKKMASFSMAVNEIYRNAQGEKVEDTHWHQVVAWGAKADIVEKYLRKGAEVAVQGKLVNRSYESKGEKKHITEVNMSEMFMLGKKDD